MTSNTFILVTNQDCSFLDTRHQLFGQVMDRESVDVIQEIINYVIIEAGMRVSENSEVKIMELTYEERWSDNGSLSLLFYFGEEI